MTTYSHRQARRFRNFIGQVRRNPYARAFQRGAGISDASTRRQFGRLGRFLKDTASAKAEQFVHASDISGRGDYKVGMHGFRGKDGGHMSDRVRKARHTSHLSKAKTRMEKGEMCIEHSEYIGDLISSGTTGTTNFVSQLYGLNPGNPNTFPWLSSVAINFQDYRFKKLVFEYRPLISESTSTSAATLTSMGSVILATQYDSIIGPYPNKVTMENSDFALSIKPSSKCLHAIECNPRFNPLGVLYVAGGTATSTTGVSGQDIRMQNLGLFQISSANIPIASNTALDLGEIWVHYEVELYKPILNAGLTNIESAHYKLNAPVSASPLGTSTTQQFDNVGLTLSTTNKTISFPINSNGQYFLSWAVLGTSPAAAMTVPAFAATQGLVFQQFWFSDSNSSAFCPDPNATGASACITMMANLVVSITGNGVVQPIITLGNATNMPTTASGDLWVTALNSTISS